jgi:hypothetical protein
MMGLQRVFVLLALGLTTTLGTIVPTSAKELGTPVHLKYSNPFRVPVSMEDRLWWNLQLQHVIQYNEAEQCRRSKDPFEIPAMILRDPNIGEAGAPPQNPTDQIEIPLFRTNGQHRPRAYFPAYAGACLDQRMYRPTLVLTPEQMAVYGLKPQANFMAIANVRGFQGFYIAWIDLNAVDQAIVQNVRRPVPLIGDKAGYFGTHAQLRVTFNQPVRLIPQWPLSAGSSLTTHELVLSIQGSSKIDAAREFFADAMDGSYLTLNTTFLTGFKVFEDYFHNSNWGKTVTKIEQFALDLDLASKRNVLERYWQESDRVLASRHFFILSNNCKVELMGLFDRALRFTPLQRNRMRGESWLTRIAPDGLKLSLQNRGLITDWTQAIRPNLEDEAETQKTLTWLHGMEASKLKSMAISENSDSVCN